MECAVIPSAENRKDIAGLTWRFQPGNERSVGALDGSVQAVRYRASGYGYHVIVEHGNGMVTLYAHCSKLLVRQGQEIKQGTVIALSGNTGKSTGPHLHFEVRVNGESQNPKINICRK